MENETKAAAVSSAAGDEAKFLSDTVPTLPPLAVKDLLSLVKYMQSLSKPLLVLTIATVFSDQSVCTTEKVDSSHDSQAYSESQQETPSRLPTSDSRSYDEVPENWLQHSIKSLRSWVLLYQKGLMMMSFIDFTLLFWCSFQVPKIAWLVVELHDVGEKE
ncbi:hypothetical protein CsSME_00046281 [Camellia sinensis var. sinensis]